MTMERVEAIDLKLHEHTSTLGRGGVAATFGLPAPPSGSALWVRAA